MVPAEDDMRSSFAYRDQCLWLRALSCFVYQDCRKLELLQNSQARTHEGGANHSCLPKLVVMFSTWTKCKSLQIMPYDVLAPNAENMDPELHEVGHNVIHG